MYSSQDWSTYSSKDCSFDVEGSFDKQAELSGWICLNSHQQGNLDSIHVGLISYLFQTSEPLSEAELFRHAAPAVWNSVPSTVTYTALSLETFKSRLKTFLYNQSFRCWSCYLSACVIRRHRRRHMQYQLLIIIALAIVFEPIYCLLQCVKQTSA